jgi:hypothetical protein
MMAPSTLQLAQRRAVDRYNVAVVPQTTEQRLHQRHSLLLGFGDAPVRDQAAGTELNLDPIRTLQ